MGSTRLPCRQLIEQERRAWAPCTRALRKTDAAVLDRLFDRAKLHVQAGVSRSRPWPFEVIAMAMLLEHHTPLERWRAHREGVEVTWSGGVRGSPSTGSSAAAQAGVESSGAACLERGLPPPVLAPPGRVLAMPDGTGGAGKTPPAPSPAPSFRREAP